MENKIQRNAIAYKRLEDFEYYICLGEKGKGYEIRLTFEDEDFPHLQGIRQLDGTPYTGILGKKLFEMSVSGEVEAEELKKSPKYESEHVSIKVDYLYLLETALDHNDMVFRYSKDSSGRTSIKARFLLFTDIEGNEIYVYIDLRNNDSNEYVCCSFIANSDFDRLAGQKKLTLLWKEKKNVKKGTSVIQYQYKKFKPDDLKK